MNFVLIGMPGSGKSSMGRIVAKKLNLRLVESDALIEKKYGKKLHELIRDVGIDAFKKIEEDALLSINGDRLVISTGGSAVYSEAAMTHLKKIGKVIYLYCGIDSIKERIRNYSERGIVMREGQTFGELFEERTGLYQKYADATVCCDGRAYSKFHKRLYQTIEAFLILGENE